MKQGWSDVSNKDYYQIHKLKWESEMGISCSIDICGEQRKQNELKKT